ncbi:transcription termination/antitermination protein NusG [Pararhizobium haloflavum]|uniref:transcription termination/antitermination protein NusG n=1 Tax=Pararhizobium haloflavum TaxID=2037914 RepID=UPI0012FFFEDB|nr:transcription termination/antitermination NusG family protein [Pararhizobium haloflavum]
MMIVTIDKRLNDPEAAERVFARERRDRDLARALLEGVQRESHAGDLRWYVLVVRRNAEERIAEAVEKLGLTTWVPMTKQLLKSRRHGGARVVERPVFEGFVFVSLVGNNYAWLAMMAIDGVRAILGGADGPMPISHENMNVLMKMESAGVFELAKGARAQARALIAADFPIGSSVSIKDGPFAFFDAVVDGYVHKRRVRAMTHLFGREVSLELDIDQIKRLA